MFNISVNSTNINEIEIYKNLRCLVCQGQSIADSNSEFAQTIKLVVKDKIKEGKSKEAIYDFLTSKYGDWILYKPQLNKTNFLLLGDVHNLFFYKICINKTRRNRITCNVFFRGF